MNDVRTVRASCVAAVASVWSATALAQAPAPIPAPLIFNVTVVGNTPLHGSDLPIDRIPAPVQTATSRDIDRSGAIDVADFLNRRLDSVHVNEVQSNPFQPDVNYRGYTASPLLGTPQGLSVYMDGVRLNQPFGDIVSWDLIPRTGDLVDGADAGLESAVRAQHARRCALARDERRRPRSGHVDSSDLRQHTRGTRSSSSTAAREPAAALHWYVTGNLFDEHGWRDDSPSQVGQLFGKLGWQRHADRRQCQSSAMSTRSLNGNGLQEIRLPRSRLRQRLHEARRDRESLDVRQSERPHSPRDR